MGDCWKVQFGQTTVTRNSEQLHLLKWGKFLERDQLNQSKFSWQPWRKPQFLQQLGLEKTSTCWLAPASALQQDQFDGTFVFPSQGVLEHVYTPHWECVSYLFTMFGTVLAGLRFGSNSVPGLSSLPPSSLQKKEQGFRFTYFAQNGPVNSPASASELKVYITSPGRFEGYLWSPAGNSPTHVVKRELRKKKSKTKSRDWFVRNFPFVSPKQKTNVSIQVQMVVLFCFVFPMQS